MLVLHCSVWELTIECHAANTTAAFLCDQTDLGTRTIKEAATETATAISVIAATLIARLTVNCFVCAALTMCACVWPKYVRSLFAACAGQSYTVTFTCVL